jgi:hypothetical protein
MREAYLALLNSEIFNTIILHQLVVRAEQSLRQSRIFGTRDGLNKLGFTKETCARYYRDPDNANSLSSNSVTVEQLQKPLAINDIILKIIKAQKTVVYYYNPPTSTHTPGICGEEIDQCNR